MGWIRARPEAGADLNFSLGISMPIKQIKYIFRKVIDAITGEPRIEMDIVGKKASIIKLCRAGKLHPRKCRKYEI